MYHDVDGSDPSRGVPPQRLLENPLKLERQSEGNPPRLLPASFLIDEPCKTKPGQHLSLGPFAAL